jgi:uncharacterized spore protein YtfJ
MDVRMQDSTALAELQALMGALPEGTVFGHPVEREGVTLVPAARVRLAGGAGRGQKPATDESGSGHGFGGSATPIGAFAISGQTVRWVPAVDVFRVNAGWQLVALAGVIVGGTVVRRLLK